MPSKYQHMHPKGELVAMNSTYPEGLLAVPNAEGRLRTIVSPSETKALTLQTREDIQHKIIFEVLHVLRHLIIGQTWSKILNSGALLVQLEQLQLFEGSI